MPEAWHIRYVGKEAKDIHDSGLSLEEYFGIEGGDYATSSKPAESKPATTGAINLPATGTYTFTGRASQLRQKLRFQVQNWLTMTRVWALTMTSFDSRWSSMAFIHDSKAVLVVTLILQQLKRQKLNQKPNQLRTNQVCQNQALILYRSCVN